MTAVFKIDGVEMADGAILMEGGNSDLPGGVQGLPTAAWYCESMAAGITVDDPAGTIDLEGWHTFTVDETECTSAPRVFSGWIGGKRISRGPYRDGPSRIIECDIWDINQVFSLEVFRAGTARRPAETDIVRAEYAIGSAAMAGTPVIDNGRFNHVDQPTNFGDADYVTQFPAELFRSIAGTAGKNAYAYWDDAAEEISINYDLIANAPASTLRISNVIADQDGDTYYPFVDAVLNRTPEEMATGLLFGYRGAFVYQRNQTLIDELSPTEFSPINFLRDTVYSTDRVGRQETANTVAASMLAAIAEEKDNITCSIRVAAEDCGLVTAGMFVDVKFSHLPGYEDFIGVPIIRHNKVPTPGRTDTWDIHLELSPAVLTRTPGGGDPDDFPVQNPCDIDDIVFVQSESNGSLVAISPFNILEGASWPTPPTPGNLLICAWTAVDNNTGGTMDGWDVVAQSPNFNWPGGFAGSIKVFWRIADGTEVTTPQLLGGTYVGSNLSSNQNYLFEVAGVGAVDDVQTGFSNSSTSLPGVTVTPTTGLVALIMTFQEWGSPVGPGVDFQPFPGITTLWEESSLSGTADPGRWIGYQTFVTDGSTYDINGQHFLSSPGWTGLTATFYCSGSETTCPAAGQWVDPPETVTLTGADGTTACPFADGTLHVYIDNVEQTPTLASQDGATGEFTLGFTPTPTEVCTVRYQGR